MAKPKKNIAGSKIVGGGTKVDEDGNTDTNFNEELEDEYEDVEQEHDIKSENNDESEEYDSDENIDDDQERIEEVLEESEEEVEEDEEDNEGEDTDIDENAQTIDEGDGCVYNFAKKKSGDGNESDDDFDEQIFDDDNIVPNEGASKIIVGDERISGNRMTKYERVRILAIRSKQLMSGAKPMLKGTEGMPVKGIARSELLHGVVPYKIRRERPDGKIEEWKISELEIGN